MLFISMFFCFLGTKTMYSNNLNIGAITKDLDSLKFTIAWDNSWRVSTGPSNYDAVWLFVKWQDCNNNREWYHAQLEAVGTYVKGSAVLEINVSADKNGAFVNRVGDGQGNIAATNLVVRLSAAAVGTYNYRVLGVEMVYIPQASFYLGDGTLSNATYFGFEDGSSDVPKQITSEAAISANSLGPVGDANNAAIAAAFPKGYNAFYIMKYEITIEQWCNFLNCLTYDQQVTRTNVSPNSAAGQNIYSAAVAGYWGVDIETPGTNNMIPAVYKPNCVDDANYDNFNDCHTSAMQYLCWADMAAFLDWSCLRPMTELEYEKVCRGTLPVVPGEFAWGDVNINLLTVASLNATQGTTGMLSDLSSLGLSNYNSVLGGPYRVGMLAKATTVRNTAGTTYYGVADMSGNVWEMCMGVSAGQTHAAFTNQLGDGVLATNGSANIGATWPDQSNTTTALGVGLRGGSWNVATAAATYRMKVSDRVNIRNGSVLNIATTSRIVSVGGRGVRQ